MLTTIRTIMFMFATAAATAFVAACDEPYIEEDSAADADEDDEVEERSYSKPVMAPTPDSPGCLSCHSDCGDCHLNPKSLACQNNLKTCNDQCDRSAECNGGTELPPSSP